MDTVTGKRFAVRVAEYGVDDTLGLDARGMAQGFLGNGVTGTNPQRVWQKESIDNRNRESREKSR